MLIQHHSHDDTGYPEVIRERAKLFEYASIAVIALQVLSLILAAMFVLRQDLSAAATVAIPFVILFGFHYLLVRKASHTLRVQAEAWRYTVPLPQKGKP